MKEYQKPVAEILQRWKEEDKSDDSSDEEKKNEESKGPKQEEELNDFTIDIERI